MAISKRSDTQLSGESVMRKRVRTCSERSSMAPRLATGSAFAKYFIASTSIFCPSTYRGSAVRSRFFRPRSGGTVIVNTLAMQAQLSEVLGQYIASGSLFQLVSVGSDFVRTEGQNNYPC